MKNNFSTEKKGTSVFENSMIWFGAGVSLAEILTGTYFAPLGFGKGFLAVVTGHAIGCVLLFMAGLIGGQTKKSAMETVKMSFGQKGGLLFSVLNVLQLAGWTSIMIYDGSLAASGIFSFRAGSQSSIGTLGSPGENGGYLGFASSEIASSGIFSGGGNGIFSEKWFWCLIIGVLIVAWILIGITNLGKINTIAMTALFALTIVLCKVIFFSGEGVISSVTEEAMSFGAAVELSVAMPLSWLPLISDYTREAEKPFAATLSSAIVYGSVSCWMYLIGMGAAIFTGESDIALIMLKAGLGIVGLFIVVFSTVTTTFLDAYSGGVSCESISGKLQGKICAVVIAAIGTVAAIIFPMDNITNFLYLIGSVFAPMVAIQIADYFILKRDCNIDRGFKTAEQKSTVNDNSFSKSENTIEEKNDYSTDVKRNRNKKSKITENFNIKNLAVWLLGFVTYRILMGFDLPFGNTLPDIILTIFVCVAVDFVSKKRGR